MANTIVITKQSNGNVYVVNADNRYTILPSYQLKRNVELVGVEVRGENGGLKDFYSVESVEKVVREDGTETVISDLDVLFDELRNFFFFKLSSSPNLSHLGNFINYNDLVAQHPTADPGDLAYVENSQGTAWLPGSFGGNYYSKGTYLWNGSNWDSSVDEISKELYDLDQDISNHKADTSNPHNVTAAQVGLGNVDNTSDLDKPISTATQTALDGKSDVGHTHVKADITDFSDSDYATAAQGALADSALQPGDNVSELVNDANYDFLNSTGFISGGFVTVNVSDPLAVDITDFVGQISDNTDPDNVIYYPLSVTGQTAFSITNTPLSWLYVDNTGTIQEDATAPTNQQQRTRVYLARISIIGGAITGISRIATPVQQVAQQLRALFEGLGAFRDDAGNLVTSDVTGNYFKVTQGRLVTFGINTDHLEPHIKPLPEFQSSVSAFRHATSSGVITVDENEVDVASYQVGGVVTAIPGSSMRYGVHFVYVFPGAPNYRSVYGDDWFQNEADAVEYIRTSSPLSFSPVGFENAFLLGAIAAQAGATDLTDPSQAVFVTTNKFGLFGGAIFSTAVITNTSDLINDGDNGVNPFVSVGDNVSDLVNDSGYLTAVSTDATISGDGTSGNPLSVVPADNSPIGSIVAYRFSSIPSDYLLLDGSLYNVDDYPALGALYGGVGGGTFNVDDFRNLPLWGAGTSGVGVITGSDTVDLSHTHTTSGTTSTDGAHTHDVTIPSVNASLIGIGLGPVGDDGTFSTTSSGDHSHTTTGTTDSQLGSTDKRPQRAHVNWIIKAL